MVWYVCTRMNIQTIGINPVPRKTARHVFWPHVGDGWFMVLRLDRLEHILHAASDCILDPEWPCRLKAVTWSYSARGSRSMSWHQLRIFNDTWKYLKDQCTVVREPIPRGRLVLFTTFSHLPQRSFRPDQVEGWLMFESPARTETIRGWDWEATTWPGLPDQGYNYLRSWKIIKSSNHKRSKLGSFPSIVALDIFFLCISKYNLQPRHDELGRWLNRSRWNSALAASCVHFVPYLIDGVRRPHRAVSVSRGLTVLYTRTCGSAFQ